MCHSSVFRYKNVYSFTNLIENPSSCVVSLSYNNRTHTILLLHSIIPVQPAPRAVVDQLFEASDDDHSGGIDQHEFDQIMVVLCSQVTSRIAVYYAILILLVPYLASAILNVLDWMGVDESIHKVDSLVDAHAPNFFQKMVDAVPDSVWMKMPNQIVSLMLFFLVIPTLFNKIDEMSRSMAEKTVVYENVTRATAEERKDE